MPRSCSLSTTPRGFADRATRAAFAGSGCEQAAAIAVLGTESTERHLVRPSDSLELPVI
ncbi:hypothetical protein [Nocardioides cavernaquae]|uniref:hypothetical protein n=1 Tax=Nocardioides cavernaquae TaxID=2321396 RepID=UPI0016015CB9|nr:hypothetical protein [Nocardioides cavernaquae]